MKAQHFEVLVEEPSMEAFLRAILPGLLGDDATFEIYPYQGKGDLMARLDQRLQGYAAWLPASWRIVVVVDRDDDDCLTLKRTLEAAADAAGLATRTAARAEWRVVFRIAIEELEAWYFGDWTAVHDCYSKVSSAIPRRSKYRNCDNIAGGTWEAFERELQKEGYFSGGLRKIEAARRIGERFVPRRCSSRSFSALLHVFDEASG